MGRRDRTFNRKLNGKPDRDTSPTRTLPSNRPFTVEAAEVLPKQAPRSSFSFSQTDIASGDQASAAAPLQAKLTIGQPGDKYEQEADRVATQVVQQLHSPQPNHPDESLQRRLNPARQPPLQRQSSIPVGPTSPEFDQSLNQARRGGSPMEPTVQAQMESAMGTDFSRVKIHTDAHADQLSRSIQAKAFTTGSDVFFKQGAYAPSSRSGQELLAHELTHVVQQSGGLNRQIQRKSLTGLDKKHVGKKLFGSTVTEDIQSSIQQYNKIEGGQNYDEKLKVLGQVLAHSKKWLDNYANSTDQAKLDKVPAIRHVQQEANLEKTQVEQDRQQATDTAIDDKNQNSQSTSKFEELTNTEFKEIYDPVVANIKAQVLLKLGVGRGEWRRSKELNEFRQQLKDTARDQAKQDIDTDQQLTNETESMKNFIKMKANVEAYSSSKKSVDKVMEEKAKDITSQFAKETDYKNALNAEASSAANKTALTFVSTDPDLADDKTLKAITAAKQAAAKSKSLELSNQSLAAAISEAREYTKGSKRGPNGEVEQGLQTSVKEQVTDDEIGKKAITKVIEEDTLTKGFDRVAKLIDTFVPAKGAVSLDIVLKIKDPQTGGFFITQLTGEAAKDEDEDGKETSLRSELTLGGGWEGLGLSVSAQAGFYFDSASSDTSKAVGLISYGFYRTLQTENLDSKVANAVWGYGGKSHLENRGEEAETWATAMEEHLFSEDDGNGGRQINEKSKVEVGGLGKANVTANLGGVMKGEFDAKASTAKEFSAKSMGMDTVDKVGKQKTKGSQELKQATKGTNVTYFEIAAALEAWDEFAGGEFSTKFGWRGGQFNSFELSAAGLLSNALGKGTEDYGKVMDAVCKGVAGFTTAIVAGGRKAYNAYEASKQNNGNGESRAAVIGGLSDLGTMTVTIGDSVGKEWGKALVVDGDYQDIVKSTSTTPNMNPLLEFKDNLRVGATLVWEKGEGWSLKIDISQVKAAKLDTGSGLNTVGSLKVEAKVITEIISKKWKF